MSSTTPRFGLPLLDAGQAQKELFHNEAVTALETLAQLAVETAGDDAPPAAPVAGRSWIVGSAPTGAWAGKSDAVATWTDGGWRFLTAAIGTSAWITSEKLWTRYDVGGWIKGELSGSRLLVGGVKVVGGQQAAIPAPSGGTAVDAEGRATINAMLAALRAHGLIAN